MRGNSYSSSSCSGLVSPYIARSLLLLLLLLLLSTMFLYLRYQTEYSAPVYRITTAHPTASAGPAELHFIVIADWGGYGSPPYVTPRQRLCASRMAIVAERSKRVAAVISAGDHFYPHGVSAVDDFRFNATFESVYHWPSLRRTPWYLVAGNHDYEGNVDAQVRYSNQSAGRWNFPYYYHRHEFTAARYSLLHLIMIDTQILCDPSSRAHVKLHSARHRRWLEQQLVESGRARASFVVVVGHHPVVSISVHGVNACLLRYLHPLLVTHNVSLYVSGHDHNLQHLHYLHPSDHHPAHQPMHYVISGASNYANPSQKHLHSVPPNTSKFFDAASGYGGFVTLRVNETAMLVRFVNCATGKELHTFTVGRRHFTRLKWMGPG